MVKGEHLARTPEARLNLIGDQEHVVLGAEVAHALQIAVRWNYDAALALDRLHADGTDVWVRLEFRLQVHQVVILEQVEAGGERAEVCVATGVIAGA